MPYTKAQRAAKKKYQNPPVNKKDWIGVVIDDVKAAKQKYKNLGFPPMVHGSPGEGKTMEVPSPIPVPDQIMDLFKSLDPNQQNGMISDLINYAREEREHSCDIQSVAMSKAAKEREEFYLIFRGDAPSSTPVTKRN